MSELKYGFVKKIEDTNFEDVVDQVTVALKSEGFGVLTEIDVKGTLKKKLDIDFRKYMILGACNPPLAHKALEAESNIGLLLPCNVVVQELTEGGIEVSIADPNVMLNVVGNTDVTPIAQEAARRLRSVFEAI